MKRMLSQNLIDALANLVDVQGVEWVSQLKELISYDDQNEKIVLDTDIIVDGSLGIKKITDIINEDNMRFFPSLENEAGRFVFVYEDEETFSYTDEIVAKTLQQTQANWEIDLKSILNTSFFKDTSTLYAKLCLLGNELELVISGKFVAKADTENYKNIFSGAIDIPDELAEKIFRADGSSLKNNPTSTSNYNDYITMFRYNKSNPTISSGDALLQSNEAKRLQLTAYGFGATTEDAVCYIDIRVQLIII